MHRRQLLEGLRSPRYFPPLSPARSRSHWWRPLVRFGRAGSEDEARRIRRKARKARSSTRGPCCCSSDSFYLGLAVTWTVGPALHFTWARNITVEIKRRHLGLNLVMLVVVWIQTANYYSVFLKKWLVKLKRLQCLTSD